MNLQIPKSHIYLQFTRNLSLSYTSLKNMNFKKSRDQAAHLFEIFTRELVTLEGAEERGECELDD